MKTTLEIPDPLFRKAKAAAAAQGRSFKQLVNEALREKLTKPEGNAESGWTRYFGTMKGHSEQMRRIDAVIEEEFERVDSEIWI